MLHQYASIQLGRAAQLAASPPMQQYRQVHAVSQSYIPSSDKSGKTGLVATSSLLPTPVSVPVAFTSPKPPSRPVRGSSSAVSLVAPAASEPLRAVATPLRTEDPSAPWTRECCVRLASDGEEMRFLGRVRVLDRHSVSSVNDAIDKLNRRLLWCAEECCVLFVPAERAYYLLYRQGCKRAAYRQLGLSLEDGAASTAVPAGAVVAGQAAARAASREPAHAAPAMRSWVQVDANSFKPKEGSVEVAASHSVVQAAQPRGRPPLPACAQMPHSYMPVMGDSAVAPPLVRYASPSGRSPSPSAPVASHSQLQQSYQPPAAYSCSHPAEGSTQRRFTPPPRGLSATPAMQVSSHGSSLIPALLSAVPAPGQVVIQNYGVQPLAAARNTPRETLERELTGAEKIKYRELEFLESLGSGEFGQVFRGNYQGEEVAIKALYWDHTLTDVVMQDLAREIESFRHLRHKRLVRFIGACLELPNPCLVTEYMPGGSLHHLLHVRKLKLPLRAALNMCMQVAEGVMYLHAQVPTVVHRDLKSLNVVLDLSLNIKICDFGLTEPMERTHITKKNNGGSPRYMAPELFDCKTKITEKIDVWALGCIFIEILGGPLPYDNITTLAELTKEMLVQRRAPLVPSFIPYEVRTVCSSCLNFDYRLRPTSRQAFEMLKAAKQQLRQAGQL